MRVSIIVGQSLFPFLIKTTKFMAIVKSVDFRNHEDSSRTVPNKKKRAHLLPNYLPSLFHHRFQISYSYISYSLYSFTHYKELIFHGNIRPC